MQNGVLDCKMYQKNLFVRMEILVVPTGKSYLQIFIYWQKNIQGKFLSMNKYKGKLFFELYLSLKLIQTIRELEVIQVSDRVTDERLLYFSPNHSC